MDCQKHLFSLDPEIHYLNCAYKSPILRSSEEAAIAALVRDRNPGVLKSQDFFSEASLVREEFARIISCLSANVAIIPSTSYGFASVLKNISPKHQGNALILKDAFPSGYFALQKWCEINNNTLNIISPDSGLTKMGKNWSQKILDSINQDSSVIVMSAVHWMTGTKFDLDAISKKCKAYNTKLIIDGSQSVGALPLDIQTTPIDALICASYKWLFGSYSIALMYLSDELSQGDPIEESWMNRSNAQDFSNLTSYDPNYGEGAARFNVGEASNLNTMPILLQGLKQINRWGVGNIQNYCKKLLEPLFEYLKTYDLNFEDEDYFSNHLFSLSLPSSIDASLFKSQLDHKKIVVSHRGPIIRASVNVFNDIKDIEALISAIDESKK